MAETGPTSNDNRAAKRVRAAKACQRCNRKRVKCDASNMADGQPCSRCRRNGITECLLIETRRGRYSREAMKARNKEAAAENRENVPPVAAVDESSTSRSSQENDKSPQGSNVAKYSEPGAEDNETPDGIVASDTSPNGASSSSYRGMSWSAMFNHFLDRVKTNQPVIDKCAITYLGESFPLALVLEDLQDGGGRTRLHHPGPPLEDGSGGTTNQRPHPAHLLEEDMICLNRKASFEKPDQATYEALIATFLDVVYPLYPIVNRHEFVQASQNDSLPWLLLQSCCFVGATFCPVAVLHKGGWKGRRQARFTFYRKAKALFDTGYESNKIVVLQSIILMSFWGGGPNNYWNTYSWLSTGVTLAETIGIHRSMTGTNMKAKDQSLLKRLWWVLMVRDAFCSCLVGRPFRINTDMGDIEMLTVDDFEHDASSLDSSHPLKQYYGLYQIQVAKLSLILHQIVLTRWIPGRTKSPMPLLQESLSQWRQEVPPALDWDEPYSAGNMLSFCLEILFQHHLILSNLGLGNSRPINGVGAESNAAQEIPEVAAQRISSAASSIVVKSQPLLVPHETFQGIFVAGVASYTQMRSSQPLIAQLGRSIVTNCQMALHNVCDSWDASPWVMNLFERLSSRPQKVQLSSEREEGTDNLDLDSSMDLIDFSFGNGLDFGSPWSSNPMLSTLFDFPTDIGGYDYQNGPSSILDFMPG